MLSLKELLHYNLDWQYGDKLGIYFESNDTKYEIACEDISKIRNYPVIFFSDHEVKLMFAMHDSDKNYFKKVNNE